MSNEISRIKSIIDEASSVVIIQADNPDADSLGSSLALEHILGDMGKNVYMYCGVDMPGYLRYMAGWDRVTAEMPKQFDASIVVDASTMTLLEKLEQSGYKAVVASKPCIVFDHHATVENIIPFATIIINDSDKSSAGEVIYDIANEAGWILSISAQENIMTSILGDTQGLSNSLAKPDTYRAVAQIIENGVNRQQLEELRKEYSKMPLDIYRYKGDLIRSTEFTNNNSIAHITIPQKDITKYSPLYNPAPLIQNDMLQTTSVDVAIVFKQYSDGKVTAAIRCNSSAPIAGKLSEHMGGGGHDLASGFKDTSGESIDVIRNNCLSYATELLENLK